MLQIIAIIASIVLPLWNIPLILRIVERKSSRDVSLAWAIGVWTCLALMLPAALVSDDKVWKIFNVVNIVLFSAVVFIVFYYRRGKSGDNNRSGI